jgi:anti-anti-sigma factor
MVTRSRQIEFGLGAGEPRHQGKVKARLRPRKRRFWIRRKGEVQERRIFVRGDVDIATAPELGAQLDEAIAAHHDVVLDCCGLTFIDSSGVRTIVTAHRKLGELGGRLRIVNMDGIGRRVIDTLGLGDVLDVDGELDDRPTAVSD